MAILARKRLEFIYRKSQMALFIEARIKSLK
jgi:hypothetical protein